MRAQRDRVGGFQRAALLVEGQHVGRVALGLGDVGLVKRVDAQDVARNRRRHLPAVEFAAQVVQVCQFACECGRVRHPALAVAAVRDGDQRVVRKARGFVGEPVSRWEHDRQDARSALAGAFGDELLNPKSEVGEAR